MSTTIHVGIDVRGILSVDKETFESEYQGLFTDHDGRVLGYDEARECLQSELAKGHERIPFQECDNWDWKRGCLGHQEEGGEVKTVYLLIEATEFTYGRPIGVFSTAEKAEKARYEFAKRYALRFGSGYEEETKERQEDLEIYSFELDDLEEVFRLWEL